MGDPYEILYIYTHSGSVALNGNPVTRLLEAEALVGAEGSLRSQGLFARSSTLRKGPAFCKFAAGVMFSCVCLRSGIYD